MCQDFFRLGDLRPMNGSEKAIQSSFPKMSVDKTRVFHDRAIALARTPEDLSSEFETMEVLVFGIGPEKYAVGSETVKEVCPFKQITRVPCVPKFVKGIINLRGQIFSVIDLRNLFDLPNPESLDDGKVVIIGLDDMEVGILADNILGVRPVPISEIQRDLPTLRGIREKYLYGLTSDRIIIINVENLLTDDSVVIHETAGTGGQGKGFAVAAPSRTVVVASGERLSIPVE
jgi:purine-binding chemotaxis protein CheW